MSALVGTTKFNTFTSPKSGVVGKAVYTFTSTTPPLNGDVITFKGDQNGSIPAFSILMSSVLIAPHPASTSEVDVGYVAVDGDVTTTNASNSTYFNNATSIAAAPARFVSTNTTIVKIPKDAWPTVTFHGNGSGGTYLLVVEFMYDGAA